MSIIMPKIVGTPGLMLRILVAGIVTVLMLSVMSMSITFVVGGARGFGAVGSDVTGRLIQAYPEKAVVYVMSEIIVGIITFVGSFFVLSGRPKKS